MHELALAEEILRRVEERAQIEGACRVSEVTIRIGRLNLVVPDSLTFYFDVCKEASKVLAAATLVVEDVPARAYCRTCAHVIEFDLPVAVCPAQHADLEWLSGFELIIANMRVQEMEDQACAEPVVAASQRGS